MPRFCLLREAYERVAEFLAPGVEVDLQAGEGEVCAAPPGTAYSYEAHAVRVDADGSASTDFTLSGGCAGRRTSEMGG